MFKNANKMEIKCHFLDLNVHKIGRKLSMKKKNTLIEFNFKI